MFTKHRGGSVALLWKRSVATTAIIVLSWLHFRNVWIALSELVVSAPIVESNESTTLINGVHFNCPPPFRYHPELVVQRHVAASRFRRVNPFKNLSPNTNTTRIATVQLVYDSYMAAVDAKIDALPRTGRLCPEFPVFVGEFGYELQGVVPWYYDVHMSKRCDLYVRGMPGSRYIYWFAASFTEQEGRRTNGRPLPPRNPLGSATPHVDNLPESKWTMPPWRMFFGNINFDTDAIFPTKNPIMVVFNKYTTEWGEPPINFISIETLRSLLSIFISIYQIVYVRMESHKLGDESEIVPFADKDMIRTEFPNVVLFDDIYNEMSMDYNLLLFGIASKSQLFVSTQGGTSVIASMWERPNFIYAVKGSEVKMNNFKKWYGKLGNSTVRAYDSTDDLLMNIWSHQYCKNVNGTNVTAYDPEVKTLKEKVSTLKVNL